MFIMKNIKEDYENVVRYLQSQSAHEQQNQMQLQTENRDDEAVFAKIRWNLWNNVFPAFAKIAHQQSDSPATFVENLRNRLLNVKEQWQKALEKAEKFEEYAEIAKEQQKLQTVDNVLSYLETIEV